VFRRRDVVFINERDLRELGIAHGDTIDLETVLPLASPLKLKGMTAVEYDISRGSVAMYYPEGNILVPLDYHDPASGTPSYKSVPVKISLAASAAPQRIT
jgi:anaerobic selenocysteine-containing dehydrogenase